MNITHSAICFLAAASAAVAETMPLPAPVYADGEVSLDIPVGAALAGADGPSGTFRVSLAFTATASNNVEFALGRDRNGDGRLDLSETDLIAGWDMDGFFLLPRGLEERFTSEGAAGLRTLTFQTRRTASGGFADTGFSVDGRPLVFSGLPSAPEWLLPPWDILRVTSRGESAPDAAFSVKFVRQGVSVILR